MSYLDGIGGGGYDFAYAGGMGYVGAGGFGGGQPVSFNTDYYGPVENQGITGFINAGGSSLWAAYGAPTMGAVGGLWRDFSGLTGISFSLDNMMTAMFAGMAYMFAGPTFAPPAMLGAAASWMGAPGPMPAGGPGGAPMYAPPMAMQSGGSARETDTADEGEAPEKTKPETAAPATEPKPETPARDPIKVAETALGDKKDQAKAVIDEMTKQKMTTTDAHIKRVAKRVGKGVAVDKAVGTVKQQVAAEIKAWKAKQAEKKAAAAKAAADKAAAEKPAAEKTPPEKKAEEGTPAPVKKPQPEPPAITEPETP